MKNRNFIILWIRDALFAAAASLTSASVLSGFLVYTGIKEDKISFYLAAVPFVNLTVSLLFSSVTARAKKTIPVYSALCLVSGVLTGLYALLFGAAGGQIMYLFLMVLGCLVSAVTAIRNIFDYKIPCEVMKLDDYSMYVSGCGIVGGVSGLAAGALLSLSYKHFSFTAVTCGAYIAAGICYITAGFINKALKKITVEKSDKAEEKSAGTLRDLFKDRTFKILLLPNFIRGIGMAVVPMIALLAINSRVITETDGATVTVFTYLATLVSCIVYVYLARRIGVAKLCALGAVLFCFLVPAFSGGKTVFYICYTVSYAGYYIINNAVPDLVYRNINPDMMSIFHTWRLALSTIGTTAATAVIGKLIGTVSPLWVLLIGAAAHIICVTAYYAVFKNNKIKN